MTEQAASLLERQLGGLEPQAPHYDYDGLALPEGLVIDGFFGRHSNVGDVDTVKVQLKGYDAIAYENCGWNESAVKRLQKVANGDYESRERMIQAARLRTGSKSQDRVNQELLIRTLYNVGKPLFVIDPPEGSSIAKRTAEHFDGTIQLWEDFEKALEDHTKFLLRHGDTNFERENYMVQRFCEQVGQLATAHPRLARRYKEQKGLRIVMFDFGLTHAGVYEGIQEVARRQGIAVGGSIEFVSDHDDYIDFQGQANGRRLRDITVDPLLLTRDMLSWVLGNRRVRESGGQLDLDHAVGAVVEQIETWGADQLQQAYEEEVARAKASRI